MSKIEIFSYKNTYSLLHKINPAIKLIIYILTNLLIYKLKIKFQIIFLLFSLVIMVIIKLNIINFFRKSLIFFYGFGFIFIITIIDFEKRFFINFYLAETTGTYLLKIINSYFFTEVLLFTTKISEINNYLSLFFNKIPLIKKLNIGLYITLTIRFIQLIIKEFETVKNANIIKFNENLKNLIKKIYNLTLPLMFTMIKKAYTTVMTLQIKCINYNRTIIIEKINILDIIFFIIFLLIFFILYIIL